MIMRILMTTDPAFDATLTMLNAEYARLTKLIEGLNSHAEDFVNKHGDSYFCTDITRQLAGTAQQIGRINRGFEKPLQHIIPWR
jgi:hypothetical protein